ncbi:MULTISPECIES: RNA 2',3'-cyclic phosphodiesterase [Micromonospora]|uniref:RNA 2',3'-cyclic phosphodiesterase n=1 Tax=Micromonospora sicca TaxID=2202420 RepID=A0A317DM52_9ACTN|nr:MULTISPECIES: RNA 2',3'-cyclic phosphodiesterase [unclassified Micromonospora]MBM0228853.1 RNA 2',3'-cyclic phosphodiesterase [Micromonospora sp. ATA51]PWR15869.1 RNA 2',3'-cyclic phosphodiesterase [Micromonospora sp. 4G51]
MRLFVAVYPPRPAVDDLTARVAELRVGAAFAAGTNVRLADPTHAHLTLAFLGDVEEERLVDVESVLGLAAETFRDGRDSSPRLRLGGGGSFGRGQFTVLWVDLRGDVEALATLARLIRFGLRRARLPHDEKPFRAHLTIARPGDRIDRADVLADRETLAGYLGPEWPASELVLVRSHPGPRPTYDRLAAWPI